MERIELSNDDITNILSSLNLIKAKTGSDDVWGVYPILYASNNTVEIIGDQGRDKILINLDEEVLLKFQANSFEYIVKGVVTEITDLSHITITIKLLMAHRYMNMRRYIRYDTDLEATLTVTSDEHAKGIIKNISRGGAMIRTESNLPPDSQIQLGILLDDGPQMDLTVKVMRKAALDGNIYHYGVSFVNVDMQGKENINQIIERFEREYMDLFQYSRNYKRSSINEFNKKIHIICGGVDETFEIRESLLGLGAFNFEVIHNFNYSWDFFKNEKTEIVIFDLDGLTDEIRDTIQKIRAAFPEIRVLLIVPFDKLEEIDGEEALKELVVLYKPLVYSEFDESIIKYL